MSTMGVDAPPSADRLPRGGFLGFLGTIPGILTALAGVITALATLYTVHVSSGPPQPTLPQEAQPAPEVSTAPYADSVADELDSAPLIDTSLDEEAAALVAGCENGFVDACTTLLDVLAWGCSDGDPYACDVLYWIAPVGSDYEAYGATCGGRFGSQYAGMCSEL